MRVAFAGLWALMLHASVAAWLLIDTLPPASGADHEVRELSLHTKVMPDLPAESRTAAGDSGASTAYSERLRAHLQGHVLATAGRGEVHLLGEVDLRGRMIRVDVIAASGTLEREAALDLIARAQPVPLPERPVTVRIPIRFKG